MACAPISNGRLQVEVGLPEEDFPDQGFVHFSVECSPCASAAFQVRVVSLAACLTPATETALFSCASREAQ